jgi:hypothetical protein
MSDESAGDAEPCETCYMSGWDHTTDESLVPVWENVDDYNRGQGPDYIGCTNCHKMRPVDEDAEPPVTVTLDVDDDLEEAVGWVERELREARRALWEGKTGKAFASIEAAQDEFETVEEAVLDD